jgi:hypothetical protein
MRFDVITATKRYTLSHAGTTYTYPQNVEFLPSLAS